MDEKLAGKEYGGLHISLHSDGVGSHMRLKVEAADAVAAAEKYARAFFAHVPGIPNMSTDHEAGVVTVDFTGLNLEPKQGDSPETASARRDFILRAFEKAHEHAIEAMEGRAQAPGFARRFGVRGKGVPGRGW